MQERDIPSVLAMTAQIVAAHVAHAKVDGDALPGLIREVFEALRSAGAPPPPAAERPEPAVPIKRSVFPDHIICLEDGKSFKTLRRHLQNVYNMSPDQYRERWGLPREYPMVAPNYAEHRSRLAKSFGLGRKGSTQPAGGEGIARGRKPAPADAE